MASLVLCAHIVDRYAWGRPTCISEESTEEWLPAVSILGINQRAFSRNRVVQCSEGRCSLYEQGPCTIDLPSLYATLTEQWVIAYGVSSSHDGRTSRKSSQAETFRHEKTMSRLYMSVPVPGKCRDFFRPWSRGRA